MISVPQDIPNSKKKIKFTKLATVQFIPTFQIKDIFRADLLFIWDTLLDTATENNEICHGEENRNGWIFIALV